MLTATQKCKEEAAAQKILKDMAKAERKAEKESVCVVKQAEKEVKEKEKEEKKVVKEVKQRKKSDKGTASQPAATVVEIEGRGQESTVEDEGGSQGKSAQHT